jgi:hypothetical protein
MLQIFRGCNLGKTDAALDFSTLEAGSQKFAHCGFQLPEFIGKAKLDIEITAVDRTNLQIQRSLWKFLCDHGIARHAADPG